MVLWVVPHVEARSRLLARDFLYAMLVPRTLEIVYMWGS